MSGAGSTAPPVVSDGAPSGAPDEAATLAREPWDVLVVGAGPAGALAAREAARRRLRVLLVDRARLPRDKVCGDCLNGRALATLSAVGLGGLTAELGAEPLSRFEVRTRGAAATLGLPRGAAVSRRAFDAALVRAALDAGAELAAGVRATLGPVERSARRVTLELLGSAAEDGPSTTGDRLGGTSATLSADALVAWRRGSGVERGPAGSRGAIAGRRRIEVSARVVLAADGLAGSLLPSSERRRARVARGSRIGVGAVSAVPPPGYPRGVIHMAVGRWGYAGLVRIEGGALNVAAALDPRRVRAEGGPGPVVAEIVEGAGFPPLGELDWRGTPRLTRRAAGAALERVLLLGDAFAYVEPFTGEGIGWALAAGAAVAPFAERAVERWVPEIGAGWERRIGELSGRDRVACRLVARGLRHPLLARWAIRTVAAMPRFAQPFVERLNALPARGRR